MDVFGLAGDVQRTLGRRFDLNLSLCGERIISAGHIGDGGRIGAGGCQQSVCNRRIVIRPCDRVLVRVDHGFAVLDRDLWFLLPAVVQEGGLRQLHHRGDGLGRDGHGDRVRVYGHAGVVVGFVHPVIDGVGAGVGPGRDLRGEAGPIQGVHQEAHVGLARRDQRLRLAAVGQRLDLLGIGGDCCRRFGDIRGHRAGVADGVFGGVRAGHPDVGGIQRHRFCRAGRRGVKGGGDAGRVDGHRVAVDRGDTGGGHRGGRVPVVGLVVDRDRRRHRLGRGGEGPLVGDRQIVLIPGIGGRDGGLAHIRDLYLAGGRVHAGGACRAPGHGAAAGAAAGGQREGAAVDGGVGFAPDCQRRLGGLADGEVRRIGDNAGQIVVAPLGVRDGNGVGALVRRGGVAAYPCVLLLRQHRPAVLDRDRGQLDRAVVLKGVGVQLDGDVGQRLALDGHGHGLHRQAVVVLIAHNLVIDGVGPRVDARGDGRAIGAGGAVQRVQDLAAACRTRDQQLMDHAVVGEVRRLRLRIEHNIRLLDHKCGGARHGVIAVRLGGDVHRGFAGVGVVVIDNVVFTRADDRAAVFDHGLGLLRRAVIGVADERIVMLIQQLDGGVIHPLGGDGDGHMTHIGIAVVGVPRHLVIYGVFSGFEPGG